jgi:hypothetical protein
VTVATPADAPRGLVSGADDPAGDTPAYVWRAGLEPIVAETLLRCATLASTIAVGATGSAGAETEAEATGVDTVAVGFGPTATAAETDAVGVETLGTETVGVVTVGVTTVWVVTVVVGTETVGVGTVGVVTLTDGVVTVGVETVGVATVGVATLGVVTPVEPRSGVVMLPAGTPSASAAPASPPHANNTNAPTDEALRRRAPLISQSRYRIRRPLNHGSVGVHNSLSSGESLARPARERRQATVRTPGRVRPLCSPPRVAPEYPGASCVPRLRPC